MNTPRPESGVPNIDHNDKSLDSSVVPSTQRGSSTLSSRMSTYNQSGIRSTVNTLYKAQKESEIKEEMSFPLGKRPAIGYHTRIPNRDLRGNMGSFVKKAVFVLVLLLGAGLASAHLFGHATVTVEPTLYAAPITKTLEVHSKATASSDLVYETMEITRSLDATLPSTGTRMVEGRASGEIIIFNTTNQPQKFREETRFESPDGLIFKLPKGEEITVPQGTVEKPGSYTATVYAEKSGSAYNIGLVDWVIPGWREISDSRFTTQYARSKTVMAGGDQRQEAIIDPALLKTTLDDLDTKIVAESITQCQAETPEHLLCIPKLMEISFAEPVFNASTTDENTKVTKITRKALVTAYLLPEKQLNKEMVTYVRETNNLTPEHPFMKNQDQIRILDANHIPISKVTYNSFAEILPENALAVTTNSNKKDSLTIHINGVISFAFEPAYDVLTEALRGQSIRQSEAIFKASPSIHTAHVEVRPFWKFRFPKNKKQIELVTLFPESTLDRSVETEE